MKPWLKGGMSATAAALLLAAASEGLVHTAQPDIATGQPNICYGDTHDVRWGEHATTAECQARLRVQIHVAEQTVDSCIPPPPTTDVRAALIDFAYNEGHGTVGVKSGLCVLKDGRYSTIRRRAVEGDWRGVCDALLAWTKADGRTLPGLLTRRARERELCLQGLPE